MPLDLKMPTASIVQYIYKTMGGNQEEVAKILGWDVKTIEVIEKGKDKYTKEQIRKILEFYKVDKMEPADRFGDGDVEKILRLWRTRISNGKLKDARAYHDKFHLEKYDVLPVGLDLSMLYNMVLVKYFINVNRVDKAIPVLKEAEAKIGEANAENQYHYHFNKGTILIFEENYKEALKHFSTAYKLDYVEVKPHAHMIHYNMGVCYSKLGMCIRAISQYETAYNLLDREQPYYFAMLISNNLSVNYIRARDLGLAKKYINDAMRLALKLGDGIRQRRALQNSGSVLMEENKFKEALEYFEEAFTFVTKEERSFLDILYHKIICFISLKNPFAEDEIAVAKLLSQDDSHFYLLFTSLSHILTLEESESRRFIENIAIPHLMQTKEYYRIRYIYNLMEKHYTELGNKERLLEIQIKSDDLYKIMLLGGEDYEEETSLPPIDPDSYNRN